MRVLLCLVAMVVALAGCRPVENASNPLRAAVVMAAEAVNLVDQECARVGMELRNDELLSACADGYEVARPALVMAQYYADALDAKNTTTELCLGIGALASTAATVAKAGGNIPPIVTEALAFGSSFCPKVP